MAIIIEILTARGASLLKTVFSFFLFFYFPLSAVSSPPHLDSAGLRTVDLKPQGFFQNQKNFKSFLRAEDDSIFDESDLIDIESGDEADLQNEDELLDQEFDDIEEAQSENNFDPEDFEELEKREESEEEAMSAETEDFNSLDYEILSDRPGYEILTDEELEQEFEEEAIEENEALEDLDEDIKDSDVEDFSADEGESEEIEDEIMEEELSGEGDIKSDLEDLGEDLGEDLEEESAEEDLPEEPIEEDSFTEDSEDEIMEEELSEEGNIKSDLEDLGEDLGEDEPTEEDLPEEMIEEPIEESMEDPIEEESSTEDFVEEDESDEDQITEDSSSLNLITNIRYLIESDQIVIDTSEIPTYQDRVNEENNQLLIEIFQAKLAKNLNWPYIMRDFDTDFGLLKADQKDSETVRVIIQLKPSAPVPPITLTEEGRIVIGKEQRKSPRLKEVADSLDLSADILPVKTLKDLYFGDIDFVGDPISFHVIDADVRQVLRFISEESGINMVIDEAVKGTVTLKLENVPWDQALYTIFKVNSLGYLRDGNIITIIPLKKIQEQTIQLKAISDRQKGLSPIETKVIPIMYGKAGDIEAKVSAFSTPPVKGLTKGGQIIIHEESNSLIVMDNTEAIQKIERLAKFLDYPSQQVMIESKIVEVTKTFSKNFGLNWSLSGDLPVRIAANGLLDFFQTAFSNFGATWTTRNRGTNNTFNLNGLPFVGNVSATLNLAEIEGTARVLNTTKILVESGKSASISRNTPILIPDNDGGEGQGGQQGEGGEQGGNTLLATGTQYKQEDVVLSTSVTPIVTSAGNIAMQINVSLDSPGPRAGSVGESTKTSRTANTEIISKSGQTVVLSGISQKSEVQGGSGFPLLRKIPFLDFLFEDSNFESGETEMLMFITPTLVEN